MYPYSCSGCGHEFDVLVTGSASAVVVACPECGGDKVERGFGVPAKPGAAKELPATNCRGNGPPCGAAWCGRKQG